MSHPCWSLPHLLTSHVPQHAARPGPRDVLQEDTVHPEPLLQEPLPKTSANAIRSENSAKESLSHPNCESAGNLRPNTPTGYEPNELATVSRIEDYPGDPYQLYDVQEKFGEEDHRAPITDEVEEFGKFGRLVCLIPNYQKRPASNRRCISTIPTGEIATIPTMSSGDTYQLYDVQREFGEQDQQAPVLEEMRGFGNIQAQSLLDQEMAEMSPVEKMSYLQSRMHFDESMESTADSDLEDEELQKLLTSPLYAQRASGRPDVMVVQESEVGAQTSHSSEDQRASGRPVALFSPKRMNRETKRGVLCSETPICLISVELQSKATKITC